jgi:hypothetical protein
LIEPILSALFDVHNGTARLLASKKAEFATLYETKFGKKAPKIDSDSNEEKPPRVFHLVVSPAHDLTPK